jgi:hypothetical protein
MVSRRLVRYGFCLATAHFMVIAILIPFEVFCRTTPVGTIAFQIHYIVDAPVWSAPSLASPLIAAQPIKDLSFVIFRGPSASPAMICFELLIFGIAGGALYFLIGVICGLLVQLRTPK